MESEQSVQLLLYDWGQFVYSFVSVDSNCMLMLILCLPLHALDSLPVSLARPFSFLCIIFISHSVHLLILFFLLLCKAWLSVLFDSSYKSAWCEWGKHTHTHTHAVHIFTVIVRKVYIFMFLFLLLEECGCVCVKGVQSTKSGWE